MGRPKGVPNRRGVLSIDAVRNLYLAGHTQDEIAGIMDVSQARVWWFMKRHGIKSRVAAKRHQRGAINHAWKGDGVSLLIKQKRIRRLLGKAHGCQICGNASDRWYQWVSVTKEPNNPKSYISCCVPCRVQISRKLRGRHD